MALRNPRYGLLSFLLLLIVFSLVYLFSTLMVAFEQGYVVAITILIYTGTALNRARHIVAPPRHPILQDSPDKLGLPSFLEVSFSSRDGIELSGWYFPSQNETAVVLVHSLGSNRIQMRNFARALVNDGFGVLMFDLRAHARSAGEMSGFGWLEHLDLLGAHDFLRGRPEIDPARIGLLGFSLGAQFAIRTARACDHFSSVWVDGLIPVVYQDHFIGVERRGLRQLFFSPWWWLVYNTMEWLNALGQPDPLVDVIRGVSPRPLMIAASGSERMIAAARAWFEAAAEPKQFWQMDDIPFGSGILEKGDQYDGQLIHFFNQNI